MNSSLRNLLNPIWIICFIVAILTSAIQVQAQTNPNDQTPTLSPVLTDALPYAINLQSVDMGSSPLPALQSYAFGTYDGNYIFVDGRTNGLHDFTSNGLVNFPPADQNKEIVVLDPVTKQYWSRPLISSDLSDSEIYALSATAPEFAQESNTLYVAGGYLYASNNFTTYPTLTALDLAGVVDWVKNGITDLSNSVRQTTDTNLQVTGGSLNLVNGKALLTFGQDYEGPYVPGGGSSTFQTYTEQVRTFSIVDTGSGGSLSISNVVLGATNDAYRRRDLNVVPLAGTGSNGPSIVALSGVFTTNGGIWTVPVEIDSNGNASMADPTASNTFKQGLDIYHSPTISLYSPSYNANETVIAGGITETYNSNGVFTNDPGDPFTSQSSVIVRNSNGVYSQYYLGDIYPDINYPGTNTPGLFGAGAQFLQNPDLPMIDGVINLDALTNGTSLGYIYGGIEARVGETQTSSDSTGSSELFQVVYTVVPEPSTDALLGLGALFLISVARRCKV